MLLDGGVATLRNLPHLIIVHEVCMCQVLYRPHFSSHIPKPRVRVGRSNRKSGLSASVRTAFHRKPSAELRCDLTESLSMHAEHNTFPGISAHGWSPRVNPDIRRCGCGILKDAFDVARCSLEKFPQKCVFRILIYFSQPPEVKSRNVNRIFHVSRRETDSGELNEGGENFIAKFFCRLTKGRICDFILAKRSRLEIVVNIQLFRVSCIVRA